MAISLENVSNTIHVSKEKIMEYMKQEPKFFSQWVAFDEQDNPVDFHQNAISQLIRMKQVEMENVSTTSNPSETSAAKSDDIIPETTTKSNPVEKSPVEKPRAKRKPKGRLTKALLEEQTNVVDIMFARKFLFQSLSMTEIALWTDEQVLQKFKKEYVMVQIGNETYVTKKADLLSIDLFLLERE